MAKLINDDSVQTLIKNLNVPTHISGTKQVYHADENGVLVVGPSYEELASSIWPDFDMTGVTDLGTEVFYSVYDKITDPSIRKINLSSLTSITGDKCLTYAFRSNSSTPGCYNISDIDFSNVVTIANTGTTNYGPLEGAFQYFHNNTSGVPVRLRFDNLQEITGAYAISQAFQYTRDIYELSMPKLKRISTGAQVAANAFSYCYNLQTVNFEHLEYIQNAYNMFMSCPELTSVTLDNISYIENCYGMFKGCSNLNHVDFGSEADNLTLYDNHTSGTAPTSVTGTTNGIFENCYSLETIDLEYIQYIEELGAVGIFKNCTSLKHYDDEGYDRWGPLEFTSLKRIGKNGLNLGFYGCSNTPAIYFNMLDIVESYGLRFAFGNCTSLRDVYFPKLSDFNINFLDQAFYNCGNVNVHFSSSLANNQDILDAIAAAGGENINAIFDQPALPTFNVVIYTYEPAQDGIGFIYKGKNYSNNFQSEWDSERSCYKFYQSIVYLGEDDNIYVYNKRTIVTTPGVVCIKTVNNDNSDMEFDLRVPDQDPNLVTVNWQANQLVNSILFNVYNTAGTTLICGNVYDITESTSGAFGYFTPNSFLVEGDFTTSTAGYLPQSYSIIPAPVTGELIDIAFQPVETIMTITAADSNLLTPAIAEGDKWSIENLQDYTTSEYEDVIRIHQDSYAKAWETAKGIEFTMPNNIDNFIFTIYANADSEKNYDFGYIALRNTISTIPATTGNANGTNVKYWKDSLGILLMKDTDNHNGCNIQEWSATATRSQIESLLGSGPYYIQIGFSQDSSTTKWTNSFYVKEIKVQGY